MSVILFTPEEIAQTFREYEAIRPHITDYAPKPEEVALALQAFQFANTMAYCLTYSGWATEEGGPASLTDLEPIIKVTPLGWDGSLMWTPSSERMLDLARKLRLFLYNAVSNAGTGCLPPKYEQTIEYAASCIVNQLAGYYD